MLHNICVFDFETTGLDPRTDHVTEIAAVRIRGGREVGSFHTLVNFGGEVPPFITELTGITTELCAQGLAPKLAFQLLRNFIGADVLVAHNAAFDVAYLDNMYRRLGAFTALQNDFLCTKTLAVACVRPRPTNYKLITLCQHFGIQLTGAHRAMNDVRATAQLLEVLRATYNDEDTLALLNCCGMGPSHYPQVGLPAHAKAIVQ